MLTAKVSDSIAKELTKFCKANPERVRIRQSVNDGSKFSACSEDSGVEAVICPAQTKKVNNCGDCSLCMFATKPVMFLGHGRVAHSETSKNYVKNGTTIFQNNIQNVCDVPDHISILKDGNDKTGNEIIKGRWKGYKILCLTLTERKTCPPCIHYNDCYGNNMFCTVRYKTDGLMDRLAIDIAKLNPKKKCAIRLHILGDFWSVEYVQFWQKILDTYPNIRIFGFTAHKINNDHIVR